ncbi:hypothetical protein O181_018106 [Austropuccinia psidii MF-1]|uniref:Uncharacterized protein n=1 Tax=Austropuccinia psidii MF-1 TaxID=1389203 RepID=A0A9Q3GSL7_9BASI|nr:hypothetical protein [Austropuccinia psidii MF-1]
MLINGEEMVKEVFRKEMEKPSFKRCPTERTTPCMLPQYRKLWIWIGPDKVFKIMVPTASTLNDLDDATENTMSVVCNNVNNERFPTTECVAPESINAALFSSNGTTTMLVAFAD